MAFKKPQSSSLGQIRWLFRPLLLWLWKPLFK